MSTLLPDRHAAGFIDNLIANRENIHKHIEQMKLTRHEMEKIANGEFFAARTKGGAEGSVAAQWKNIMAAIGGPMMQPYIDRMNNLATVFNKLGASVSGFSARNPGASGAIGSAVVGAAAMLATLGALATGGLMIGAMRAGLGFLGVGGAARVGGAVATGGAGAALPVAAMIAAPIVAAKGVGLLARGLGLITGAAALAGRAILGFHLGVNGLAGGVLGRVFLTAKAATGLGLLTTGLYTFRSEIVDVTKEVANLAGKMYALGDSFFNTKLGSKETSKKLKDLIGAVADDLPDQNIGDRFANYVGKGLNNSGATSYARWWLDYDNSRTPYGDRAIGNGMVAPIYTDAELRRRTGINGATDYMFPWDKEKDGIYAGNAFKNPDNYTGKILDKYVYEKPPPMPQNQNASAAYFLDPASIPQSWGKTEVAVRSMVGVTIPPSIAIQVTGSLTGSVTNLQGSVTGSASAPIHAAPRGESAPVFSGRESGGYDG